MQAGDWIQALNETCSRRDHLAQLISGPSLLLYLQSIKKQVTSKYGCNTVVIHPLYEGVVGNVGNREV